MFRRIRYKKWLVAGLGLAALVIPGTALANTHGMSNSAYKALVAKSQLENQRYGGSHGMSFQAYQALVAKSQLENQRYGTSQYGAPDGWTPYVEELTRQSQGGVVLDGRSPDTQDAALTAQQGYFDGRSQDIRTFEQGVQLSKSLTPVDGRSPDTVDSSILAHSPIQTVVSTPGFQWGDFGIGGVAALGAMILLALSMRFLSNRNDRKGIPVATA